MRLFVAIDLPNEVKIQLESLRFPVPGANWVRREALHLTLQFLGDGIPNTRLDAVRTALALVEARPFELKLRGVGAFQDRVLWVGVDAPPALAALRASVGRALASVGFAADRRPFRPHITLARLRDPGQAHAVEQFLTQNDGFSAPRFPVSKFILFSSQLTPQGAVYTAQAAFSLR